MGTLSGQLTKVTFGADVDNISIARGTINSPNPGDFTESATGSDLGTLVPFRAMQIWNAVWNDIADHQLLNDELIFGKCYYDTKDGARICTERCQMSVIGVASDTFGFGVGSGANQNEVPIAICGWVLAHVDQDYPCGTPLTNDEKGNLTAMTLDEKRDYPERIVAIFKRKEMDTTWGPVGHKIQVNGRSWVKVKS